MATARLREARRAHLDPDTTPGPPALPTIFSRANKCLSLGQIPEGSGDYPQCLAYASLSVASATDRVVWGCGLLCRALSNDI